MTDVTAIPVLRSPDLRETALFYGELLGFATDWASDVYLILRRDGIELHVCPPDGHDHPTESCAYLRGPGIDALYAEWSRRNVPGLRPFVHRPWGMYEFYVSDPHGCLLKFGRSDREGTPPLGFVEEVSR